MTDRAQPAPPLPTDLTHFAGRHGHVAGWELAGPRWRLAPEGLSHDGPEADFAWREGFELTGDWAAEVALALPDPDDPAAAAGLIWVGDGAGVAVSLTVEAGNGGRVVIYTAGAASGNERRTLPLPRFGDGTSFHFAGYHTLEVSAKGGLASARLDGVTAAEGVALPRGPLRLGVVASGAALLDAVGLTRVVV